MVIPERTQCCLEIKLLGAGDYLSPSGGGWLPGWLPLPWWLPPSEEETEAPPGSEVPGYLALTFSEVL